MDWKVLLNDITGTGIRILISIVILLVSFAVINWVAKKIDRANKTNKKLDKTLTRTFLYVGKVALKILVALSLVNYLGIDTSGITALITSLGVCVGLAVNGALANIAGGVLLLITRPFRVDDYVEVAGYAGTVEDIFLCNTKLRTLDNRVIYIPNGTASTGCVVNYSMMDQRRVDLIFNISYEDDFRKAEKVLGDIMASHEKILPEPEPFVRMTGQRDSSIELTVRAWTKREDYWDVYFDLLETVKERFDREGIHIPFNQLDVHVKQED